MSKNRPQETQQKYEEQQRGNGGQQFPQPQGQEQVPEQYRKLTREDLEKIAGEPLPERAAMSLINANVAAPINLALAANVLSDNSAAIAIAEQQADIDQST